MLAFTPILCWLDINMTSRYLDQAQILTEININSLH